MNNRFWPAKFEDFTIVTGRRNRVVGHIRVKPSGIHWAPKSANVWYGVDLNKFSKWMIKNGRQKAK